MGRTYGSTTGWAVRLRNKRKELGSWHAEVELEDGVVVRLGVKRGGYLQNVYGRKAFKWYGWVAYPGSGPVWEGRVDKGVSAVQLLRFAGLVKDERAAAQERRQRSLEASLAEMRSRGRG